MKILEAFQAASAEEPMECSVGTTDNDSKMNNLKIWGHLGGFSCPAVSILPMEAGFQRQILSQEMRKA